MITHLSDDVRVTYRRVPLPAVSAQVASETHGFSGLVMNSKRTPTVEPAGAVSLTPEASIPGPPCDRDWRSLPIVEPHNAFPPRARSTIPMPAATGNRPVVLLVGGNPSASAQLRTTLDGQALDLILTTSADEALGVLERMPVDVLLSNGRTLTTAGVELQTFVRESLPRVVRIVLTEETMLEAAAGAAGAARMFGFSMSSRDPATVGAPTCQDSRFRDDRALRCAFPPPLTPTFAAESGKPINDHGDGLSRQERRRHPRAVVALAATVFGEGGKVGDYVVENLSAGGALLLHGPPLERGVCVHAVLQGPGVDSLGLDALVQRSETAPGGASTTAVKFRELSHQVEDRLQQLVLRALERCGRPAVLVVHGNPIFLASMARDLVRMDYEPLIAVTDFEVARRLGDRGAAVRAVIAELLLNDPQPHGLFTFIKESFPRVRRIAVVRGASEREFVRALALVHADDTVDLPWTRAALRRALRGDGGRAGITPTLEPSCLSEPP